MSRIVALYTPVNTILDLLLQVRRILLVLGLDSKYESENKIHSWYEIGWNLDQGKKRLLTDFLLRTLRRFPYWLKGHLLLAQLSLDLNNTARAYASVQAAKQLNPGKGRSAILDHILARCYLRSGGEQRALELLDKVARTTERFPALEEDRAAALMVLGREREAQDALEGIDHLRLSQEGKTALSYLRRKLKQSSSA